MKKGVTAEELMAKLNADPVFVANQQRRDEERKRREAEFRRAEAPLIEEIRAVGFVIHSVWDLVNTTIPYTAALPVLFEHLLKPYPPAIRDGIARALAVTEARFGWNELTRLYRAEPDERVKAGLAAAISVVANDDLIGDVISLAKQTSNGPSRGLLLSALKRSADPRARATLMALGTDPDLTKEIQVILERLRRSQVKRASKKPPTR